MNQKRNQPKIPDWLKVRAKRVAAIRTGKPENDTEYIRFLEGYLEALRDLERLGTQEVCLGGRWVVSVDVPLKPPQSQI